ncbi:MAG TPA: hypothetical protein VL463_07780 [Kofleriaceae bacterium]|nr:hypothetical protein [Kofleriaceae bacterium]
MKGAVLFIALAACGSHATAPSTVPPAPQSAGWYCHDQGLPSGDHGWTCEREACSPDEAGWITLSACERHDVAYCYETDDGQDQAGSHGTFCVPTAELCAQDAKRMVEETGDTLTSPCAETR